MTAILACVLVAGLAPAARAAPPLPFAEDLARVATDARERRVPVLLAFMQKTCPYCARARRHLEPLRASAEWSNRAIMLEIDVDSTAPMRDFAGDWTTPRDFSRRHGVRMVPTLIVFDPLGSPAADPVIGIASDDFYTYYVVQALEKGRAKSER
ncbi:MAG TPA: thioredoxin fold domain-containing protein [Burkholderiales bacterium]|nr:thioredoxin fold domain-containing protein [Burkholderiales bacterium]